MDRKSKKVKAAERRDSPRVPMTFLLRDVSQAGDEWSERDGDLSLGGIAWHGDTPPHGSEVEVRFRLPGVMRELRARGEIIRVKDAGTNIDFHVRFTELEVHAELAIAKYLHELQAT